MRQIIFKKQITEKSTRNEAKNVYIFEVAPVATKYTIAEAMQSIYGVKPLDVRVQNRKGKVKRVGKYRKEKQQTNKKIAYISLSKELPSIITESK